MSVISLNMCEVVLFTPSQQLPPLLVALPDAKLIAFSWSYLSTSNMCFKITSNKKDLLFLEPLSMFKETIFGHFNLSLIVACLYRSVCSYKYSSLHFTETDLSFCFFSCPSLHHFLRRSPLSRIPAL